jgi:hypothetical protein
MSYVVLRARWCNVIILIAHALTFEKSVYAKGSCYKEIEQMVGYFAKYHMKIPVDILRQTGETGYFQADY